MSPGSLKNQPKQKSGRATALPAAPLRGPWNDSKSVVWRAKESAFFHLINGSEAKLPVFSCQSN